MRTSSRVFISVSTVRGESYGLLHTWDLHPVEVPRVFQGRAFEEGEEEVLAHIQALDHSRLLEEDIVIPEEDIVTLEAARRTLVGNVSISSKASAYTNPYRRRCTAVLL